MEAEQFKDIAQISVTDLVLGLLVALKEKPFMEQQIYNLFKKLGARDRNLAKRVRVCGSSEALHSEPLRQTLSFLELGKVLELPQPNPVGQYYKVRLSHIPYIIKELEKDNVLPRHRELFDNLANQMISS